MTKSGLKRLSLFAAAMAFAAPALAFPVTVDNCGTPLTFDAAPERIVVQDINMSFSAFGCGPCVKPHGCSVIMPGAMLSREKKLPA